MTAKSLTLSEVRKWAKKLNADSKKVVEAGLTEPDYQEFIKKADVLDLCVRIRMLSKDVEYCIREIEKGKKNETVQDVTKF